MGIAGVQEYREKNLVSLRDPKVSVTGLNP